MAQEESVSRLLVRSEDTRGFAGPVNLTPGAVITLRDRRENQMAKQSKELGLAQEIADQRRGVRVGVVKIPVTVVERWEGMARKLEGLPPMEHALPTRPTTPSREELHPDAQDPDRGDRARAIEAQQEREEQEEFERELAEEEAAAKEGGGDEESKDE